MQKYGTLDPAVWEKFISYCETRGVKPSSFTSRVVRDVISDRYIHLQQLREPTLAELVRSADESGETLESLVSRIISEWCLAQMAKRKKK